MDAREIEKCIDEFGTDIYRFCLKLCMDKSEAEDLYQQTFLKALEAEWTLDWEQNPKALFFSLTHNLWKSDRRKQARRNMIAPSSNLDDEAETVLHSEESIEESYLQKELILEVNRIIETLPEKIRIPLTLFYLSNCSVEQMLHADISCETVPDGASLTLWLVQGDVSKSFDVTNLSDPLEYSLSEFENGKIHVRLQINGVEDTISEIYVK